MARMVLMCGHPGSGKSYYAKDFAKKTGFRYLSIDDMYATFNGDPYSHENKFDVWMTLWRQIHLAELAGQDIIMDTNAPTVDDRNEFLNWFPNFTHYLVWIDAPMTTCLKNNEQRKRKISAEHMKDMFTFFQPPTMAECANARTKWKQIVHIKNVNNKFERVEDIVA